MGESIFLAAQYTTLLKPNPASSSAYARDMNASIHISRLNEAQELDTPVAKLLARTQIWICHSFTVAASPDEHFLEHFTPIQDPKIPPAR